MLLRKNLGSETSKQASVAKDASWKAIDNIIIANVKRSLNLNMNPPSNVTKSKKKCNIPEAFELQ